MRATIGITTGDPAGIGLETILKSISLFLASARWILFTDSLAFQRDSNKFNPHLPHRWVRTTSDCTEEPILFLIDAGSTSSDAGQRALSYLEAASAAALRGEIRAIVTAPVSKEAIGRDFKGQTDYLALRAGCGRFAMAFFTPGFKVVLATIHLSLREALDVICVQHYVNLIRFTDRELRRFGFDRQRIAVAGINPHAGENGMFGREEIDILKPAVDTCAAEGIIVSGPYSADSLYYRAHSGEFDVVIAPYHDQGLIPVKLIAHGVATNVTLGLPYVRTSPDHGTAFSIAGKGVADPSGMQAALRCALELVNRAKA
jgi:4-hydroxythreonine-4-phosphate dehydrogenase